VTRVLPPLLTPFKYTFDFSQSSFSFNVIGRCPFLSALPRFFLPVTPPPYLPLCVFNTFLLHYFSPSPLIFLAFPCQTLTGFPFSWFFPLPSSLIFLSFRAHSHLPSHYLLLFLTSLYPSKNFSYTSSSSQLFPPPHNAPPFSPPLWSPLAQSFPEILPYPLPI